MSDTQADTANAKATRAPTPSVTVRMDDGSDVVFSGKRKMLKTTKIDEATGETVVRMDFVNGEVRHYNIVAALLHKFAAHGAEQKLGDEIAGVEDVEDCVAAIDELLIRLEKGEWNLQRDAKGLGGASILAKALIEMTGKDKKAITEFLSNKSHAEKIALRANSKLKPIIDRLEAEKNARTKGKVVVDSDALLDGLTGEAPAEQETDDAAAAA